MSLGGSKGITKYELAAAVGAPYTDISAALCMLRSMKTIKGGYEIYDKVAAADAVIQLYRRLYNENSQRLSKSKRGGRRFIERMATCEIRIKRAQELRNEWAGATEV